jgi:hypothetical protein
VVDGAGHGLSYFVDKESYEKKMDEFIGKFLK